MQTVQVAIVDNQVIFQSGVVALTSLASECPDSLSRNELTVDQPRRWIHRISYCVANWYLVSGRLSCFFDLGGLEDFA